MARSLRIPNPENATIDGLAHVSQNGSNQTAKRCAAIQRLLAGADEGFVRKLLLAHAH